MNLAEPYIALEEVPRIQNTVLTVGFFDGVHLGHQSVLDAVVKASENGESRSAMVTFDRAPRAVISGADVPLLTTLSEKAQIARRVGISTVVVVRFDEDFAELKPEDFVESILVKRIGLRKIILGYDHRFGRGGTGDVEMMRALGDRYGFAVEVIPAQHENGSVFSSTRIRELLSVEGNVALAAEHLGRPYKLRGIVVAGDGRGKQLGFPTANLDLLNDEKVVPATGVYAVFVAVEDGEWRRGVMNVGYRPTLTEGDQLVVEVHLLDFEGSLYGTALEVAFIHRLRAEKRFDGLHSLVRQINQDVEDCVEILDSVSLPD